MTRVLRLYFMALFIGLTAMACNSDEGNPTTDNPDPGNADSLGAGQTNNNNVGSAEAAFVSEAAYSGLREIEASKQAQSRSQSAVVKELANMMVTDHTLLGEQLRALAAKKNIALRDTLTAEDRDLVLNNKKAGREFDREYTGMMVDDHEAAVRKFENAAANSSDPEVKALATEALPRLRHHLEQSKAARDKVKG